MGNTVVHDVIIVSPCQARGAAAETLIDRIHECLDSTELEGTTPTVLQAEALHRALLALWGQVGAADDELNELCTVEQRRVVRAQRDLARAARVKSRAAIRAARRSADPSIRYVETPAQRLNALLAQLPIEYNNARREC